MKLVPHLIPKTSWGNNIRKKLSTSDWRDLSEHIRGSHDYTCELCGWKQEDYPGEYTECHEVWEYDDVKYIQKISKFECLCKRCHAVRHWGRSMSVGWDKSTLVRHACRVNETDDVALFIHHVVVAANVWKERSKHQWTIDYDGLL